MKKLLLTTPLFVGLCLAPTQLSAQNGEHQHDNHDAEHHDYYDSAHKDHHDWNDNENQSWNRYRDEHHVKQSDFSHASKREQQRYWNWRHEHPDSH